MRKNCRECGDKKEITEYYNQKRYKDGLDPICKTCRDTNSRKWLEQNTERAKDNRKKYYIKNKEKIQAYRKDWYINKKKNEVRD